MTETIETPSYGIRDMSEIVLRDSGNTYVGALANQFLTGTLKLPQLFSLDSSDQFHVLEIMPDNSVVHRASQSTFRLAASYMTPERVMVYRGGEMSAPEKMRLTAGQRQKLIAGGWEPHPTPVDSYWIHRDDEGEAVLEAVLEEDLALSLLDMANPHPDYGDIWDAYFAGALDARMNPTADNHCFRKSADAYCKLLHSVKAPEMFNRLGVCKTCNGRGEIGGLEGGFSSKPCQDCQTPKVSAAPLDPLSLAAARLTACVEARGALPEPWMDAARAVLDALKEKGAVS